MIQFCSKEIRDFAKFISDDSAPPVNLYVFPEYDVFRTRNNQNHYFFYVPVSENQIVIIEENKDVKKSALEDALRDLAHEYCHHLQKAEGKDYNEDEADKYAEKKLEEYKQWKKYKEEVRKLNE